MAVAMLALFVALSGTAVATTSALITGRQIKNGSITGLDVKNRRAISAVRCAVRPDCEVSQALPGSQGAPGTAGASGAPGSAIAFARVNADGTVDEANSKNVADANVTHPELGVYY
jgi:hypothetical protein